MVKLALSMGDPAGIGPELCVRAAADPRFKGKIEFVIYGAPAVLALAAERWSGGQLPEVVSTSELAPCQFEIGIADAICGRAAYDTLTCAACDAIGGKVDALVTAPMNKYAVNLAKIPFTGHTERIAELAGCESFAMMQSAGQLRVAFVTTHIALAEVPRHVTKSRIVEVGQLLDAVIRSEGIAAPRLAAAALNPHAGESGCMGREDEDVVKPALAELNTAGIAIEGPFPPDVMFIEKVRGKFDGILSMYHDQGHIPFKMLAFDMGVNSTIGLPFIRTSPDHGTAFDIAWRGVAGTGSFYAAIEVAARRAGLRE